MNGNERYTGDEAIAKLARLDANEIVCTACEDTGRVTFKVIAGRTRENVENWGHPLLCGGPDSIPDYHTVETVSHPCKWCKEGSRERRESMPSPGWRIGTA